MRAVRGADFSLAAGEVHALVGENGAGKSTLMHIAAGMVPPDAGTIQVDGQEVRFHSPRDARELGIGMVHQHFTSVPGLTVAENLALAAGRLGPSQRSGGTGWTAAGVGTRLMEGLPPNALASGLSVAQRQRLEILKALATGARILLLDEPTALLTPVEVEELDGLIREFVGSGGAVALITHKLREVLGSSDRVTVLRRGIVTLRGATAEQTEQSLAQAMIGGEGLASNEERVEKSEEGSGEQRDPFAAPGVTVEIGEIALRAGELVGVAAVEGNGHRELLRAIAGLEAFAGIRVTGSVALVPEDRTAEGLIGELSLTENLVLGLGADPRWARGARLDWNAARQRTAELIDGFAIVAPGPDARAGTLSGGNQQKLLLARALERQPAVLVMENPTRGLDVRTTQEMHQRLRAAASAGVTVIVHSTDLDEVLALADRILVVHRNVVREAPRSADRRLVGEMMLGVAPRQRSTVNGQR
ncbi:MAG TPA: ATP-binding cassette domain-containing protein [Gemmatimonadales bacterium]|nr:ATP-binding cassette domain-containing protein [Gemmatimonadales bacterium]